MSVMAGKDPLSTIEFGGRQALHRQAVVEFEKGRIDRIGDADPGSVGAVFIHRT